MKTECRKTNEIGIAGFHSGGNDVMGNRLKGGGVDRMSFNCKASHLEVTRAVKAGVVGQRHPPNRHSRDCFYPRTK